MLNSGEMTKCKSLGQRKKKMKRNCIKRRNVSENLRTKTDDAAKHNKIIKTTTTQIKNGN